jgi:hypothetical protein
MVQLVDRISPRNPHPAFDACGNEWRHALARIFNEGAPVEKTLNELQEVIEEILEGY